MTNRESGGTTKSRAIATQSRTIRLPVHITEKLNKIKKAQRKISQEQGRTATIEDIAKELGMDAPQVREVLMRVPRSVSLEIVETRHGASLHR